MAEYEGFKLPSHGRGRMFNPCRAHQIFPIELTVFAPCRFVLFGTERHTTAELGIEIRGETQTHGMC